MFDFYTLVFFFNKVTDDLVIEIGNGFPGDALAAIFVLFRFERQLDKELLKLFVAVIDAKLLETVGLKDLKAVNVQNAEHVFLLDLPGRLEGSIEPLDQPSEHALVDGFG